MFFRQHQILWNLFAHNLDSVIMGLIESEHLKNWITPLVQLIALVYKDQHVSTLERLLNLWLESSLSESSEDNESNTTPQNHLQEDNGCYSSSLLTSTEPNSTDDASDGNGSGKATRDLNSDKGTCGCKFYLLDQQCQCQNSKILGDSPKDCNPSSVCHFSLHIFTAIIDFSIFYYSQCFLTTVIKN